MSKSLLGRNLNNFVLYAAALLLLVQIPLTNGLDLGDPGRDTRQVKDQAENDLPQKNNYDLSNHDPNPKILPPKNGDRNHQAGGVDLVNPEVGDNGVDSVTPNNQTPRSEEEKFMDTFNNIKSGFLASLAMILVSEVADKTFFIAAILAGTFNKWIVFAGSFGSLVVQTVLSVAVGRVLLTFLKIEIAELISNLLFLVFGCLGLKDGLGMEDNDQGELREVQEEIKLSGFDGEDDPENPLKGRSRTQESTRASNTELEDRPFYMKCGLDKVFNKVFMQAFTMTFIAEWGDRSQIATINLAATHDAIQVCLGGIIGHCICTGIAVIGGSILATKINAKTITLIGAFFFLAFGAYGLVMMYVDEKFQDIFG